MSFENFGNIGEFVGWIVVVVSLFYLAYQVRQNTQSLPFSSSFTSFVDRLMSANDVDAAANERFLGFLQGEGP